ncbi:ABC transporter ATP-binding protein [Siculibacillus lacustris]|uniref:ABC transporter ATP-binding protein n=1 Tax=Siculibacillus lacustris TaxID=1549641 RepID=UPI0019D0459E|nr:ABC transporter ATP-binding protein [Siculibacillus lacustris]
MSDAPLLRIEGLTKHFHLPGGRVVHAVEDVNLAIDRGHIVGLVGESGSGKTTVGRTLLRLTEPTAGRMIFDGTDVFALSARDMRVWRRRLQIIFQDPYSSLDPRLTIAAIIDEALDTRGLPKGRARRDRIAELLELVGLAADHATRYPHQFSGGQRQRIGIARALAVEPDFIVADEPVSALDVSVQAQVLNLLEDLRRRLNLTMLFISHDLSVVEYACDEIVVMYLGRIMEKGPSRALRADPLHPYTKALLASAPQPDPTRVRTHVPLAGDIPSPISPPSGCVFRTRCPIAIAACATRIPPTRDLGGGRSVACLRVGEGADHPPFEMEAHA